MGEPVRWIKSNPRWLRIFHRKTLFISRYLQPTNSQERKFRFFIHL